MSRKFYALVCIATLGTVFGGLILNYLIKKFDLSIIATTFKVVSLPFVWFWDFLVGSQSIPGVVLLFLIFLAAVGCWGIFIRLKVSGAPWFHSYCEDTFYGATWRWLWDGDRIRNLVSFCPTCEGQLVCYTHIYSRGLRDEYISKFKCENCGDRVVAEIPGTMTKATGVIKREIGRQTRVRAREMEENS
ncbi:hypothetical protein ACJJIC_06955 [Microbulbifer sp. ANSA002]|uniref:hypothetical protein n=1 Tax=unclassified Microbulbifer TaxID=2619833 RepID=UPI0040433979